MTREEAEGLIWDIDGREVVLDYTVMMGHGYDWDGWECFRQEAKGPNSLYAVWPTSGYWQYYASSDGVLGQADSEQAAKSACEAHALQEPHP